MANLNDALKMHIGNLIIRIAELEVENENLKIKLQETEDNCLSFKQQTRELEKVINHAAKQ